MLSLLTDECAFFVDSVADGSRCGNKPSRPSSVLKLPGLRPANRGVMLHEVGVEVNLAILSIYLFHVERHVLLYTLVDINGHVPHDDGLNRNQLFNRDYLLHDSL